MDCNNDGDDEYNDDPPTPPVGGGDPTTPSSGTGNGAQPHNKSYENIVYMGGATPASIPGFEADSDFPSWSEAFYDLEEIASMFSPTSPPTLRLYLAYTQEGGNVVEINLIMQNSGETSARLNSILMSEETPPSYNVCVVNTTCRFKPQSPVYADPGETDSVTICKNCLANNTSVFNHSFGNNRRNMIEVKVVMSMLIDWGYDTRITNIPFMYTIPRR